MSVQQAGGNTCSMASFAGRQHLDQELVAGPLDFAASFDDEVRTGLLVVHRQLDEDLGDVVVQHIGTVTFEVWQLCAICCGRAHRGLLPIVRLQRSLLPPVEVHALVAGDVMHAVEWSG
jgi:hypothetical protein